MDGVELILVEGVRDIDGVLDMEMDGVVDGVTLIVGVALTEAPGV